MSKVNETSKEIKPKCGIIMPISANEAGSADHWAEVYAIIKDVFLQLNYTGNLVSETDESSIIQKTIIQNVYNCDIVICDISSKNPNVMFELGLRLAFDKPTIIIKDDKTEYIFDTGVIEHIGYPRDLRFSKIVEFKEKLKLKIEATLKKAKEDPSYSTFLKNFGQYKVATLDEKEVTSNEFILSALADIRQEVGWLRRENNRSQVPTRKVQKQSELATVDALIEELIHKYAIENNVNIINLDPFDSNLHKYLIKYSLVAAMVTVEDRAEFIQKTIERSMLS